MKNDGQLTAYCGLYCGDCIPSKTKLYRLAARLEDLLKELKFDKYAELKAGHSYWSDANSAFKDYPRFISVLQAIRGLECKSSCRKSGGWKGDRCMVRNCAMEKGLYGCWECEQYKTCRHMEPLLKFHPNLAHHLALIRKEGVDRWAAKRKEHYPWS